MTPFPHVIEHDRDVRDAEAIMSEQQIRHLAVTRDGKLVGVLSQRDLQLAQSLRLAGGRATIRVDQLHSHPAYTVSDDTPLLEVVRTLGERRLGSALVTRGTKLIGIHTPTDVCRLYADSLEAPEAIPHETA
jgi:acetoin utilization protein AcuB